MKLANFNWFALSRKITRHRDHGKVLTTLVFLVDDFFVRMMFLAGGKDSRSEFRSQNVHPSWLETICEIWVARRE